MNVWESKYRGMPDYIEAKLKTYDINKLYGRMYIKALFTDEMQA